MGRIKIEDLPKDHKISQDEMRNVVGGMDNFSNYQRFTNIDPNIAQHGMTTEEFKISKPELVPTLLTPGPDKKG